MDVTRRGFLGGIAAGLVTLSTAGWPVFARAVTGLLPGTLVTRRHGDIVPAGPQDTILGVWDGHMVRTHGRVSVRVAR